MVLSQMERKKEKQAWPRTPLRSHQRLKLSLCLFLYFARPLRVYRMRLQPAGNHTAFISFSIKEKRQKEIEDKFLQAQLQHRCSALHFHGHILGCSNRLF